MAAFKEYTEEEFDEKFLFKFPGVGGISVEHFNECRRYMKVDGDDEDDDRKIIRLMNAAKSYLKTAGASCQSSNEDLYVLVWYGLTLYYYDHPEAVGGPPPETMKSTFNQLKFKGSVLDAIWHSGKYPSLYE